MTADFSTLAGLIRRLSDALAALEPQAATIGVAAPRATPNGINC